MEGRGPTTKGVSSELSGVSSELKGVSSELTWLKIILIITVDRFPLKGESPRFSADFIDPLSCQSPFKFPRQLV